MNLFRFLFFCVFISSSCIKAQDSKVLDSLNAMTKSPVDSVRIRAYVSIAGTYVFSKPDLARQYAQKAITEGAKLNYMIGVADAWNFFGGYYFFAGRFDSSLHYNQKVIDYYEGRNIQSAVANLLDNRGSILESSGNMQEAIKCFERSMKYYVSQKDTQHVAANYSRIAGIQMNLGEFDLSVKNFITAQKMYESIGHEWGAIVCINNIAGVYKQQKLLEKAVENYKKVLELSKAIGKQRGIIGALDNIGATYVELKNFPLAEKYLKEAYDMIMKEQGSSDENGGFPVGLIHFHLGALYHFKNEYKKAEEYYLEAERAYTEKNDVQGLSQVYTALGTMYQEIGKYDMAIPMIRKSVEMCRSMGLKPELKQAYAHLALAYAKSNDFEKAYEFEKLSSELKDSLYEDKTGEVIAEMEAKYDTEKKEKELSLKNSQLSNQELVIKQQNQQKLFYAGGALLMLIAGILLLRGNNIKRKANKELQAQKEEIVTQKHIIEEKNKDITDSIKYAQRIQEAILPSEEAAKEALPDHFVFYQPKDIISGDFYWVEKKEELVFFAVADCTGHGVPGALMSIVGNGALNKAVNEHKLSDPANILDFVNKSINDALRQNRTDSKIRDGMDIALCVYDTKKKTIEFAGANNPLYLMRKNEIHSTPGDKQPIGSFIEELARPFTKKTVQLEKGDRLFIFSDGFADQFGGPQGKKFKYARLQKLLIENASLSMNELKEKLASEFVSWKGNLEQIDDVCVMGVGV
jgi:serine phosphatase RsbU (regulator of sigma subunit)